MGYGHYIRLSTLCQFELTIGLTCTLFSKDIVCRLFCYASKELRQKVGLAYAQDKIRLARLNAILRHNKMVHVNETAA